VTVVNQKRKKGIRLLTLVGAMILVALTLLLGTSVFAAGDDVSLDGRVLGIGRIKSDQANDAAGNNDKLILNNVVEPEPATGISALATPIEKQIKNETAPATTAPSAQAAAVPAKTTAVPTTNVTSGNNASGSASNANTGKPADNTANQAANPDTKPNDGSTKPDGNQAGTAEWQTGLATAYGQGFYGRKTTSGAILTADSFGVAVPVSQSYLLGSTLEISWGGKTLRVLVNDTGTFDVYGRSLDLQPGVWKAFGFSDEYQWGVRVVKWRVVS